MDVPFLGAQNRVYLAGLLSPFRSTPDAFRTSHDNASTSTLNYSPSSNTPSLRPAASLASLQTSSSPSGYKSPSTQPHHAPLDPTYNPPFLNDIRLTDRDWWQSILHFKQKHKDDGLLRATFRHWKAHFEFGSCLLDSRKLKIRYNSLRRLDVGEPARPASNERARFVQFYTACYKGRAGKRCANGLPQETSAQVEAQSPVSSESASRENHNDPNDLPEKAESEPLEEDLLYFCRLARQEDRTIDPAWRQIMIATNDEINAHTSLFMPGRHYDDLIESVSGEMAGWISDARRGSETSPWANSQNS